MEFLGVGPAELVFILIIALIVVGPERLPVLARQAGKFLVTVRDWVQKSPDAAMILRAREEIEAELANLRSSLAEVQGVRDEVVQAAKQMNTIVTDDVLAPTRAALDDVVKGSIARSTKPNGLPVEVEVAPAAETLIAPDGSVLAELPPADEMAMIRPPLVPSMAQNTAAPEAIHALSAQVESLMSELRALQAQLQERGVLTAAPQIAHAPAALAHERFAAPQTLQEENDDVEQPVLLRD